MSTFCAATTRPVKPALSRTSEISAGATTTAGGGAWATPRPAAASETAAASPAMHRSATASASSSGQPRPQESHARPAFATAVPFPSRGRPGSAKLASGGEGSMVNWLSGKAVIVTGAARGVGLAVARRFVRAGALVTMADMDEKLLEQEVEALGREGGEGRALAFAGDTREKLTMTNLVAATIDAWERIDVLVNAGRLLVASDPLDPEADRLEASLRQNVTANLRLSQIVARRMIELAEAEAPERGDRAIVNLSSVHARRSAPELMAYSVSCAALEQLTRVLALALAPHGIRVNAIAVGGVPGRSLVAALPGVERGRGPGGGGAARAGGRAAGLRRGGGLPRLAGGELRHRADPRRGRGPAAPRPADAAAGIDRLRGGCARGGGRRRRPRATPRPRR